MPEFTNSCRMPVSADELFRWHMRPGAFERLAPPWEDLRVIERPESLRDGARLVMEIRKGPLRFRWVALHDDFIEGRRFRDVQVEGPFAEWSHLHCFEPLDTGESLLEDRISYRLPCGAAGRLLGGGAVRGMLYRMFHHRNRRLRGDLARHRAYHDRPRQRVAITGATGLIGTALRLFLQTGGHTVHAVTRRRVATGSGDIHWDPREGTVDREKLEGLDAVIHLAGEPIAGKRWTPAQKREIRDSRVVGTRNLCEALARLERPPRALISASAVGGYGDRGDEILTEESPPGTGFLPEICAAWEAATRPAAEAGIRVAHLRIGIVLSPKGGALAAQLPLFRLGLGGPLGAGRQWLSWIALDDLVGAFHHLLFTETARGAFNGTAPNPVRNVEFTRALGHVLKRPALLPAPGFALKLVLGAEMAQDLLLSGNRVLPARLEQTGFEFRHPHLDEALRAELGLPAAGEPLCPG